MRVFALRGAISVDRNDAADIHEATTTLMREIMQRNALAPDDVVSCIFTATEDLDADFPAAAARTLGFDGVPLLCARDGPARRSSGSARVSRAASSPAPPSRARHVYLREASALRSDLQAAQ